MTLVKKLSIQIPVRQDSQTQQAFKDLQAHNEQMRAAINQLLSKVTTSAPTTAASTSSGGTTPVTPTTSVIPDIAMYAYFK